MALKSLNTLPASDTPVTNDESGMAAGLPEKYQRVADYSTKRRNARSHTRKEPSKKKKDKKERRRRKRIILDNHGLITKLSEWRRNAAAASSSANRAWMFANSVQGVKELLKYPGSDYKDINQNALARIEDLVALIAGLKSTTNMINFLSICHLYMRTFYTESLTLMLMEAVKDAFGITKDYLGQRNGTYFWSSQAEVTELDEFETKLKKVKDFLGDWKRHKECDLKKNVANLINIAVTIGFMPHLKESPVTLFGFEVFKAKAWDVQAESGDFVEVCLDTAVFFLDRGYAAFKYGDPSLLLYSDADAADMEREYALLISALPLLESNNLDGLKKFGESIADEQEYENRVFKLKTKLESLLRGETNKIVRNTLSNKCVALSKVITALINAQKQSGIRIKPFGVNIFGGSSVGKTTINGIIQKIILTSNNFQCGKEYVITLNENDKYQSEFRACHTAVTMDDFGNTKAEHYEGSPTAKIIDFLNNVPKAALNADVALKGNVMIKPKLVTVTTNVKDLLAGVFSNEPASILRRFELILDAKVRPDWVDPATGGLDKVKMAKFTCPDAWLIDVQCVKIIRRGKHQKDTFEFVDIKKEANIFEVLDICEEYSKRHFEEQELYVAKMENLLDMPLCQHNRIPGECPKCAALECPAIPENPPPGNPFDCTPDRVVTESSEVDDFFAMIEKSAAQNVVLDCHSFEEWLAPKDILFCPLEDFDTESALLQEKVRDTIAREPSPIESLSESIADWYVQRKLDRVTTTVKGACSTIGEAFKAHRTEILAGLGVTAGLATTIYVAHRLYKACKELKDEVDPQGNVMKTPVKLPTDEPSPWKQVVYQPIPKTEQSRTATVEQLTTKISHQIAHAVVDCVEANTRQKCDIFPLCESFWLAPNHVFDRTREYKITATTVRKNEVGVTFTQIIDKTNMQTIAGTDYVILNLPSGGDVYNFVPYFPTDKASFAGRKIRSIFRNEEGELITDFFTVKECNEPVKSKKSKFNGYTYYGTINTFEGMCMTAHVLYITGPVITGFHLAGKTGETYGAGGHLTQLQVKTAIEDWKKSDPELLFCHSTGTMLTNKYEKDFTPKPDSPPKNAVNWTAENENGEQPCLRVFGAHPLGGRTFRSNVRKSPISDAVERCLELKRIHGPPKNMNTYKPWQADISKIAHTQSKMRPKIMRRAMQDMRRKVDKFFEKNPDQLELIHPYSNDAVLAGIDGVNAVDRVALKTSMGFPLNKPKSDYIKVSDIPVEGITEPLEMDPQIWAEVDRMEEALANGERIHTIFRANLKDEATKLTKDKVRVFAGSEMAFTCLMRRMILSVIRLIQTNWIDFECAVGINAFGADWTKLAEHLQKFGTDRSLAGDYASFDKNAAAEALMYAYSLITYICEKAGYNEHQLAVVRGIGTEICYPTYEYDGVIIQTFGSNPSGHAATVILNNLLNSFYMRYAYYALHENDNLNWLPDFDVVIALICYGDDNAASISAKEKLFNHTTVQAVFADLGIEYTMADKQSKSVPFIKFSEVDFLKRGFVFDKELGQYLAPIEEASIAKSLHNYMRNPKSETEPLEVAANAITSAAREYFRHGKETYQKRIPQLLDVVDECAMRELVPTLPSYEEAKADYLYALTAKRTTTVKPKEIHFD